MSSSHNGGITKAHNHAEEFYRMKQMITDSAEQCAWPQTSLKVSAVTDEQVVLCTHFSIAQFLRVSCCWSYINISASRFCLMFSQHLVKDTRSFTVLPWSSSTINIFPPYLRKNRKNKKSWKNTKTQHQNNWVIASCAQGQKALTKAWFGTGFGSGHSQSQWTFELEPLWLRERAAHCYLSYRVFLLLHIECQQSTALGQSVSSFWQKWTQKGKWKQKEKLTYLITDYGCFNLRQPQSLLY